VRVDATGDLVKVRQVAIQLQQDLFLALDRRSARVRVARNSVPFLGAEDERSGTDLLQVVQQDAGTLCLVVLHEGDWFHQCGAREARRRLG